MTKQGITPEQIEKAIYGIKIKSLVPIDSPLIKKAKPEKAIRPISQQDNSLLLGLPYSDSNLFHEISTPSWFKSNQKVDVSIIIPLYKSVLNDLIESWDLLNDGLKTEILFIDDQCPFGSSNAILSLWEQRKNEISKQIGRIYQSEVSQGWGACCNFAAQIALGNILVFLNPNGKLFPGSLLSLVKVLKKSENGLVGGLHVNETTDSVIESGREWSWEDEKFLDIGSETYANKKLNKPFVMTNTPVDIFQASERELVSSSLMAVRKNKFIEWGGFSCNLYTQEWSDADLCMFVKELGYKIVYQPNARLYGSYKNKEDKYSKHGKAYFFNKWVASGRIDKLVTDKRLTEPKKIQNILIKRQAAHGDVLIAAAIAPALKKKYPGAKILFTTECPEVLKNNPYIDRVLDEHSERQFDLFCNLDMAYEYRPQCNILKAYAETFNLDVNDCSLFLSTTPLDITLPEKYIVIHAGKTLWVGRNWTTIKFDQISNRLKKAGCKTICVGTTSDHKPIACDIDLRGQTNIEQLAHVIKNSQMFIGIDSFPMHVAQTFNISSVIFFGSIKPETRIISNAIVPVYADGLKCLGCHHSKLTPSVGTTMCHIGIQDCINEVSTDRMWNTIQQLLEKQA